jgi:hypothetical protein
MYRFNQNGKLVRGATRGDGLVGEDITQNLKTIQSIPLVLNKPYPDYVEVRGEAVMSKKVWQELNKQNDIFVASVLTPDINVFDLQKSNILPDNTSFFDKDTYKNSDFVKKTFVDDKGNLLYDPFVLPKFRVLLLTSPSVFSTTKISNYGVYSTWTKSTSNTQSSIIGNFGSELTSDGRLNAKYIGGEGDKGVKGG